MRLKLIVAGILLLLGLVAALSLLACGDSGETATPGPTLPPRSLLQGRCASCHSLDRVQSARKTQAEWEQTVRRMRAKGTRLSDAEAALLVSY